MGTKAKDWAWAKLGIAPTCDKDVIHAAYAAKRAQLDAEAMRISAFAELTEAREKALFLASELQREAERSKETNASSDAEPSEEVVVEDAPAVDAPELQQEAPAEPEDDFKGPWEKASEPESDEEWEHGGGYQPAYDLPEERSPYAPKVDPGLDPIPDEEWSHSGSYIPDSEKTIDPDLLVPPPSANDEVSKVDRRVRGAVRSFFERYPVKTHWALYAIMAFFLLRTCS